LNLLNSTLSKRKCDCYSFNLILLRDHPLMELIDLLILLPGSRLSTVDTEDMEMIGTALRVQWMGRQQAAWCQTRRAGITTVTW
jgi:hypothetical protein